MNLTQASELCGRHTKQCCEGSSHVGLIREAAIHCERCQAFPRPENVSRGLCRHLFEPVAPRAYSICEREPATERRWVKSVPLGPQIEPHRMVRCENTREQVRPVAQPTRGSDELVAQHRFGLAGMALGCPDEGVEIDDSSERRGQRARQRYIDEHRAVGADLIGVSVERAMDQDVPWSGLEATVVACLLAAPVDHDRSISTQVVMAPKFAARFVQSDFLSGQEERHQRGSKSGGMISEAIISTASSRGITSCRSSEPSRRTATVPSSASRLPTTSSNGTLARLCSRTL